MAFVRREMFSILINSQYAGGGGRLTAGLPGEQQ
jgi:hypothetical protein